MYISVPSHEYIYPWGVTKIENIAVTKVILLIHSQWPMQRLRLRNGYIKVIMGCCLSLGKLDYYCFLQTMPAGNTRPLCFEWEICYFLLSLKKSVALQYTKWIPVVNAYYDSLSIFSHCRCYWQQWRHERYQHGTGRLYSNVMSSSKAWLVGWPWRGNVRCHTIGCYQGCYSTMASRFTHPQRQQTNTSLLRYTCSPYAWDYGHSESWR